MANWRPRAVPFIDWYPEDGVTPSWVTFTRASAAYDIDSSGQINSQTTNVLRDRYNPDTLAYEGKWFEPASTNKCLQSEDLATTWTADANTQIDVNDTTAPDGNSTADKIEAKTTTSAAHDVNQTITVTADATLRISVFLKAGEVAGLRFGGSMNSGSDAMNIDINASSGTIAAENIAGSAAIDDKGVDTYPNGWYRFWFVGKCNATDTSLSLFLRLRKANGDVIYSGVVGEGCYAWGVMVEEGSGKSTSYIKTTTTSVTRAADVCSIDLTSVFTGHNFNTEGTMLLSFYLDNVAYGNGYIGVLSDGTNDELIGIQVETDGDVRGYITDGGSSVMSDTVTAGLANDTLASSALSWKANDGMLSADGTLGSGDTSLTLPTIDTISFGATGVPDTPMPIRLARAAFFSRAIPDSEIKNFTTQGRTAYWRLFNR